ncbi:MAG: aldehyde ferredoxin oxidoreductase family protein [Chloroflexi bacterium]|nr:aldehyde ferredoxin oxidoreductase family protein [Chloroflexota bacterium]MCL5025426.1 aldehyde ferredoxin oxidoreductase family protein [Chloroflexota bacterium]
MPPGYNGKILRINLSTGSRSVEEPSEVFYRTYFGGRGFNAYFLMKELKPGVDPLGPDNKLIFSTGPITGHPVSGNGRNSVGAKSPLTGAYGEGDVGGFWGAELKHTGFDAIIVEGKSPAPVYLWVHNGEAEVRDAARLWGLDTAPVNDALQAELGDKQLKVAQVGPAGERLVRFAAIMNDVTRAVGRTGMGAVMGSKNLKAIAVRGRKTPPVADREAMRAQAKWLSDNMMELNGGLHTHGTDDGLIGLSITGGLPTRNFQEGTFERAEDITGSTMTKTILTGRHTCYACAVICKRIVKTGPPYNVDPAYGGPEYETCAALGSCCGIGDLEAIAMGNQRCNAMGLDTISTGTVIAFAMECFEKGLLTREDTGGLELRFGNAEAMLQTIELIGKRRGIGDLLAEGVARAARQIGRGAEQFAMHVKGQELPMHEPRIKHGLGLGYSVSPTGADHVHNLHDTDYEVEGSPRFEAAKSLGILEPVPFNDLGPEKLRLFIYHVNWQSLMNCVGLCIFPAWRYLRTVELVRSITGWNTSLFEMVKVGERMNTLCRAFNVREGFSAADDTLPERFFQPFADTKPTTAPLDRRVWEQAKLAYYYGMGWDENGVPTRDKLGELNLEWVIEEMEKAAIPLP